MADSQKFIGRNRAPRVQIEYDVEVYGAEKKMQLPFVMGVMSDLSGKSEVPKGSVEDRKFLEIDVDNFNDRMKSMKPRAQFAVPNTMTGEGNLSVDLTFERMEDFSPAAVAAKVEPLRKLLEARTQLDNLLTYMDGKAGAEALIEKLLQDQPALKALMSGAATDTTDASAVLANIAASAPSDEPELDDTADVLAAVADSAPTDTPDEDTTSDVLAAMAESAPEEVAEVDESDDILAAIADAAPAEEVLADEGASVLAQMAAEAPEDVAEDDGTDDLLASMAEASPADEIEEDTSAAVLDALAADVPDELAEENTTSDVLSAMADLAPTDEVEDDGSDDVLAALAEAAPEDAPEDDGSDALLDALAADAPDEEAVDDGVDDLLAELFADAPDDAADDDGVDDLLTDMSADAPDDVEEDDGVDALLSDLAEDAPEETEDDTSVDDLLSDMAEDAPDETEDSDDLDALLADVADDAPEEAEDDGEVDALLADLADGAEEEVDEDDGVDALLDDLASDAPEEEAEDDDLDALLADVSDEADLDDVDEDDTDDVLASLADDLPEDDEADDDLDALLADVAEDAPEDSDDDDDDLDALLADVADEAEEESDDDDVDLNALLADEDDGEDDLEAMLSDDGDDDTDLDALLSGDEDDGDLDALLADDDDGDPDALLSDDDGDEDLDALLADDDDDDVDLDALLSDDGDEGDADLDALLSDDDGDEDLDALLADDDDDDVDLDALLSDDGDEGDADLDALLSDDDDSGLDDMLADDDGGDAAEAEPAKPAAPYNPAFGKNSAPKPEIKTGDRRRMRVAILGDFSGRANRGDLQGGADLAARKPIKFDVDTVEDIIERFSTTLHLNIGKDGSVVEVELADVDGLHPDELFDNVEFFNELRSLRTQISRGTNLDSLTSQLQSWGAEFGDFKLSTKARAKGSKANTTLAVSEFAQLIGAEPTEAPEPTGIDAMIQRVVGPYVQAAPDASQAAMLEAVDHALSAAMSSILHHPDFQAVEANWRTLDMLARRVETGQHLEMVLYDVSVEEFTADLAANEDLGESALYDMLVERPRLNEDQGPLAAVFGMYTFEETPPHAELLARMSKICSHMDAPFVAAIGADFLKTKADDLHPLVAKTWAAFRETPEAKYVGLASPRFLLRMPYGKKTDPVDPFDYEEFNAKEGLRSMLFGNPAALVMVLLAKSLAEQGSAIQLGSIMSVDDMPFHYMNDQYGDQVALPSTERLLNERMATDTRVRGYMPVLSIQGQNVVRLGSFNALGGGEILGLWAGDEVKALQAGKVTARTGVGLSSGAAKPEASAPGGDDEGGGGDDDDDLGLGGDDDFDLGGDDDFDLGGDDDFGSDGDLDDLLGGFDDDGDDDDDDGMDDDLEALLADL